jgi:hypothetical protein
MKSGGFVKRGLGLVEGKWTTAAFKKCGGFR